MNAVDRPQLLQLLRSRRDEIADNWYQAIERASDEPLKATEVRQRLVELTEQIITLLATDPFDHNEARSIGAALVHLDHIQPEALCRAQEILVCQLVQGLPADQVVALQPRLATLIGALATGFFQRTREIILTEHDQIRSTLIAKRKQAAEEIRKFKTVADQSNYGMAISDLKGNLQYVNEYFAEIHGYSSQELVGENLEIFHNKEQLERVKKINEGLIETGSYSNEEVWHTRKDDTTFPVLMNGVIIKDDKGEPQFLAATAIDITARKRAEAQATQSNRLAAMGWLAAALAHEINNPLQAIQANLELAMDFGLEPDEHEKHLHVVRQEIERLAEIARRVLDFARPADDTRYPVSITHLIQKALQLVGKQLELSHIQATTDLPADLPSVFVAPNQILQVLLNLSGNAIEAMPDGGRLHIAARAGENVVELALTNDGPPLSAEHIERIFDPFFTTKPNGAGLGLSISHSIIRRHGGTINVENLKDQQGVAFTITLPIARPGKEQEVVA